MQNFNIQIIKAFWDDNNYSEHRRENENVIVGLDFYWMGFVPAAVESLMMMNSMTTLHLSKVIKYTTARYRAVTL